MLAATAGRQPGPQKVLNASTYLALLAHHATRRLANNLDPVEQRLVESMAADWLDGTPVTVTELMQTTVIKISPSTAHRRLKTLRAKGMITLVNDRDDKRIKHIQPSQRLLSMFEDLSLAMKRIAHVKGGAA